MFRRLLWQMMLGNRGRLAVALVAIVSGAAVISALLNLQFDIERKLTQEFRVLGANVVIGPAQDAHHETTATDTTIDLPSLIDEGAALAAVDRNRTGELEAVAPFFYFVAHAGNTPVVVAGTWLDQLRALNPSWQVEGNWVESGNDPAHAADQSLCVIGRNVAQQLNLSAGRAFDIFYEGRAAHLTVSAVADSGGTEDNQVFIEEKAARQLTGQSDLAEQTSLVQLNVRGTPDEIAQYASRLGAGLPNNDVHPIREVAVGEGALLSRIRLLIASMVGLILILTALSVLATMAALAMERREDVGLMKALGGPISRILALFLTEVGVLGAVGGVIGCIAGVMLSRWMGERVFGASISPRWDAVPLTVGMMVLAAMAGALPLRMLGKVKPAVILRGE
jgi:putative ABC transport system permease protein